MKKILMKRDPYLILYFIMQPLAAICDVLSAKALADAVDFAIRGRLDDIFRYIMAFAALIAVSFIVELTHNRLLWKLFGSRTIALRKECHRKLLYMPYRSFMKKNTGEHISNLTRDMTYMTQEPAIFNDTIFNNVTLYEDYSKEVVNNAL